MIRTVVCAECGTAFETRSPRAKFCPGNDRCRKAASRRPSKLGRHELAARESASGAAPALKLVRVPTQAEVLQELDATAELLERDLAYLDARFAEGDDPVLDELIGGLATYLSSIAGYRAFALSRGQ